MTLVQLKYFIKAAETENLSRVAEALHVSQPSLSYSIKELEKELGVGLFRKEGRNLKLTAYGTTFLTYAKKAIESIQEGCQMLSALSNQNSSEIKIGAVTIMGIGYVPKMVNRFYEIHHDRNFNINIEQQVANIQTSLLKQGECEIAFGPYIEDPDIELKELYKEKVMLAVSRSHRLAGYESVGFDDFANENMVTFLRPAGIRKQIDNYFMAHGKTPNILYEVTNELMVAGIVESVSGVALLPCSKEEKFPNVVLIPIRDADMLRPLYAMKLRTVPLKPLTQEFWDFIISQAEA